METKEKNRKLSETKADVIIYCCSLRAKVPKAYKLNISPEELKINYETSTFISSCTFLSLSRTYLTTYLQLKEARQDESNPEGRYPVNSRCKLQPI